METEFSPAPWSAHTTTCEDDIEILAGNDGYIACMAELNGEGWRDRQRANAALIAAAPSLYNELENILEWGISEGSPLRPVEIAAIQKVLAIARGEKQ